MDVIDWMWQRPIGQSVDQLCDLIDSCCYCIISFVCFRHLGDCYWNLGNLREEAIQSHSTYLEMSQDLGNALETQRALTTLGGTYFNYAMSLQEEEEQDKEIDIRNYLIKSQVLFEKALQAITFLTQQDCPQAERTEMKLICYRMLSDQCYLLGDAPKGGLLV